MGHPWKRSKRVAKAQVVDHRKRLLGGPWDAGPALSRSLRWSWLQGHSCKGGIVRLLRRGPQTPSIYFSPPAKVSFHPAGRCSVGDQHSEVRCHQSTCGNTSRLQQAGCPVRLSLCSWPPVTSRRSEQACLCAHTCACFHTSHLLKLHSPPCGLPRPRHGFSQSSLAVLISGVCGTLPKIYSSLARGEVAFCPFSKVVSVLKTKAKNQKTSQTPPCHLCSWLLGPRPFSPSCPGSSTCPRDGAGGPEPWRGDPTCVVSPTPRAE